MSTSQCIGILDDYILLSIFDTITAQVPLSEVPRIIRPLTVIRVASQVCRRWRGLTLASPWIWGRVIDLREASGQQEPKWMEEVAIRSGSAPLWIYGDVVELPDDFSFLNTQQYFLRRLTLESWERVEKLSVFIRSDDRKILEHLQNLFLTRAPILKLFDVRFSGVQGSLFLNTLRPESSQRLFADYAPSLRVMMASQIAYRLDSPWLPQIREISPFPKHLTLENIFAILQRTPIIELIRIQNRDLFLVQPPPFKLTLPNLFSIFLVTSLSVVATILNHVTPGTLSRFLAHVEDSQIENLNLPFILSSVKENLPSYISNYFTTNPPTFLWLGLSPGYLRFSDLTTGIHDLGPRYFEFSIRTDNWDQHDDWDNLIGCVVDALIASSVLQGSPSIFQSVTELRTYCAGLQPALIAKLYSALAPLRNVRDIHTNEVCAHTLLALTCPNKAANDPRHILFPQLHTVHLDTVELEDGIVHNDLTQFIIRRKKIGFPVAKLDLTHCKFSTYAQDLRDLEAAAGLEVIWKRKGSEGSEETCSYICGTGDPEQLKSFRLRRHRCEEQI